MSATIRATSKAATSLSTDKAVTVAKPSGTVDGDLLLAFFSERKAAGTNITAPSGFTEIASVEVPPVPTVGEFTRVYRRIANAEPADYTWTWDVDGQAGVIMFALNVQDGVSVAVGVATASGTNHKTPDVFAAEPSMLLLAAYMVNIQSSFTVPAGFVENEDVASGASNGITVMVCNKIQATRGNTGQFTGVSADAETGTALIVTVRDPAVSEKLDFKTGIKTNVLNATNVSAGVQILTGDVGFRQQLRTLFVSAVAATEVRIEDAAGRILVPDIRFGTGGGIFGPETFEKDQPIGGIGQAIEVKGTGTILVSTQISVKVVE